MRNIAPCASCHASNASKLGAPWLGGQPYAYLINQLGAFANGTRRNDTSEQMRNVTRQMTSAEIEAAARFYAEQ
jgi:cytochrome c553